MLKIGILLFFLIFFQISNKSLYIQEIYCLEILGIYRISYFLITYQTIISKKIIIHKLKIQFNFTKLFF